MLRHATMRTITRGAWKYPFPSPSQRSRIINGLQEIHSRFYSKSRTSQKMISLPRSKYNTNISKDFHRMLHHQCQGSCLTPTLAGPWAKFKTLFEGTVTFAQNLSLAAQWGLQDASPQVEQHKPLAFTGSIVDLRSSETCPFLGSVCFF